MRYPPRLLGFDRLEDRCVPAVWGLAWPDAKHLALSFAPDDTPISGHPSGLYALLGAESSEVWQRELVRAFQTWAVAADVNVSVTPDSGAAFGAVGLFQGDARFGDVRIGAQPLAANQLATTQPFGWLGGTGTGDLVLNSSYAFGDQDGAFDLFSVALHEAGHVLGLPHSADRQSVMFEGYAGPRQGLAAGDVAALRALYGARQADVYDGVRGNDSFPRATSLLAYDGRNAARYSVAYGDVTTRDDRDVYRFTPSAAGAMTVRLWTSGASSLAARVTVYDGVGQVVATAAADDPLHGDLALPVQLLGRQSYYVVVEGNATNVFGMGSYRLVVQPDAAVVSPPPLDPVLTFNGFINYDHHTNDRLYAATPLQQKSARVDARFDRTYEASLSDAVDVDYYQLVAPAALPGLPLVLTAAVWRQDAGQLDPHLDVYDGRGRKVAANVLTHQGGALVVQIPDAVQRARYYLKVRSGSLAPTATGNYFLAVDFGTVATRLQTAVGGTLTTGAGTSRLLVYSDTLFHFLLTADAGVQMTIWDAQGANVFSVAAGADEPSSGNVMLAPGEYVLAFVATGTTPAPVFDLRVACLNEDIDPYLIDPNQPPSKPPTGGGTSDPYLLVAMSDCFGDPLWY